MAAAGKGMEWIIDELELLRENRAQILQLNYKNLQEIPALLTKENYFAHVEKLFLKRNCLQYLPKEISNLQGLVELYLHGNNLKELPNEIGDFQNLRSLDITSNQIKALPASIGRLKRLQKLQIGDNFIERLPKEIGQLKFLITLEAIKNHLTCIPDELCDCVRLQTISLDSNRLKFLPRQICKLRNLTYLSVCANDLLLLPVDIGKLRALKKLYVDDNPHLMSFPASTFHKQLGYHGCSQQNPSKEVIQRFQHITLKNKFQTENDSKVILCPPEIRVLGNCNDRCVPSLLEIALKGMFYAAEIEGVSVSLRDLPEELRKLVQFPTATCHYCNREIFIMGYPIVYQARVKMDSVYLFGLCCTNKCVKKCSTVVNFPVVYPPPENVSLALVLVPQN